jgi:3'-phosphoadenosine 5'-phosphosulfate sulfotransferase (PAPS reductase)/FAD synthetase
MTEPFLLEEPGILSFSGGRTSGLLLRRTLDAYNGTLPDGVKVVFCNTGREMEETLRFVRDCASAWSVPIVWLEYREAAPHYEVVTFETASRDGRPFLELLRQHVNRKDETRGRRPLPNVRSRICTTNLKTRLKKKWARHALGWKSYFMAIGFRADEGHRVTRGFKYAEPGETLRYPLHAAGITKDDVLAFWAAQPFSLELLVDAHGETIEGNCDLCFMKSAKKVSALAARYPDRARWWAEREVEAATTDRPGFFRQDRPSYQDMLAAVERGEPMDFGIFDDLTTCGSYGCTD